MCHILLSLSKDITLYQIKNRIKATTRHQRNIMITRAVQYRKRKASLTVTEKPYQERYASYIQNPVEFITEIQKQLKEAGDKERRELHIHYSQFCHIYYIKDGLRLMLKADIRMLNYEKWKKQVEKKEIEEDKDEYDESWPTSPSADWNKEVKSVDTIMKEHGEIFIVLNL